MEQVYCEHGQRIMSTEYSADVTLIPVECECCKLLLGFSSHEWPDKHPRCNVCEGLPNSIGVDAAENQRSTDRLV